MDCETVTDCGLSPWHDTVIVPMLLAAIGLATNATVIVALPLPLKGVTVNQFASSETDQLEFELIVKVVLPASKPTSWLVGATDNDNMPFWLIVTV